MPEAMYQYGPFPWTWCHETNAGHGPEEECEFQIGCNICRDTRTFVGEQPEAWDAFVRKHVHRELRLRGIPKRLRLGMTPREIRRRQDRYG